VTPVNISGNARALSVGLGVGITISVLALGGCIAGYCLRRRLPWGTSTKETQNVDPDIYCSTNEQFRLHELEHGTISLKEIHSDSPWSKEEAEQRTKATSTTQHCYKLGD
jgi:hypothetical protein